LAFAVSCWYLKFKKQDLLVWFDFTAPLTAFTYAFGRIGCFLAGCCYGKACQLPWAVVFPKGSEGPAGIPVHPTQLYAFFWESLVVVLLLVLQKKKSNLLSKKGDLFWIWFMLHGLGRIIMETYRADYRGRPYFDLSISTWLSLILMVIGAFMYLQQPKDQEIKK
jgi:phosphatidylglycerol:prolipoprotein diacylglycerol transferase